MASSHLQPSTRHRAFGHCHYGQGLVNHIIHHLEHLEAEHLEAEHLEAEHLEAEIVADLHPLNVISRQEKRQYAEPDAVIQHSFKNINKIIFVFLFARDHIKNNPSMIHSTYYYNKFQIVSYI